MDEARERGVTWALLWRPWPSVVTVDHEDLVPGQLMESAGLTALAVPEREEVVGAQLAAHRRTLTKAWADIGYKNKAIQHAATCGIDLELVQRNPSSRVAAVNAHARGFHDRLRRHGSCSS